MTRPEPRQAVRKSVFLLLFIFTLFSALFAGRPEETSVEQVVDRAYQRFVSYSEFGRWQALVVSSQTNADRHWQPEKISRVTKWMKVDGGLVDEEILEAIEIENGRTKDITDQYRKQRLERLKKIREEREKAEASGRTVRPGLTLSLEDLVPFSEKNRDRYDFRLRDEAELNGQGVYLVEARARKRNVFLFEGLFFINRNSYDLERVEITPVKMPGFIHEFRLEADLELWQGQLVVKKLRIKIFGRFLLKSIRRIVEEEYLSYRPVD